MISRRALLASATALALSVAPPVLAQSGEPMRVVATFSILGDMIERIGGSHVSVTTLVGPDGDAHVYQPTPAAARAVSEAEILVVNGLDFEGWLDRLIDASDFDGTRVVATEGIEPIAFEEGDDDHGDHAEHGHGDDHDDHAKADAHDHEAHAEAGHDDHDHDDHAHDEHGHDDHAHDDHAHDDEHADDDHGHDDDHAGHHHGAFDPHAWQSLGSAVTYVDNITAALAQADPANAGVFYQNRADYVAEIEALEAEIREIVAGLPDERRTIVTSHDAFQYFGRDYGLTFLAPQGLSTESEASAQDVARLIEQMRENGISAVFVENITDPRLLEQIANETGASIGGTLYPGALSGPDGPAPTYLEMMRHNATTLAQALGT
ncbi:MAG: zinc ABC transporter substrate-binding protein [Pseudomonadota bacterium]